MKKLKFSTFFVFSLFLIGSSYGQTTKYLNTATETWEVYCEGEVYDIITGTVTYTFLNHSALKNSWNKIVGHNNNLWHSTLTDEVYKEIWITNDFRYIPGKEVILFQAIWRLDGNMGSHIICNQTWEVDALTFEILNYNHKHKCL